MKRGYLAKVLVGLGMVIVAPIVIPLFVFFMVLAYAVFVGALFLGLTEVKL